MFVSRIRGLYRRARGSAFDRGIEFLFTIEEWVKWWEGQLGPDWMEKRGCRKGQYVMARFEDKGPYAPWNVKCITCSENTKEYEARPASRLTKARGEKHYAAKLTKKEVAVIRRSKEHRLVLADQYGVNWSTIYRVQTNKIWR